MSDDRNPTARYADEPTPDDSLRYEAVCRCLRLDGDLYHTLSHAQQHEARTLADGCGPLMPDDATMWKWAHISDSSIAGMVRVHDYLVVEGLLDA
jgi:hypothetical protein